MVSDPLPPPQAIVQPAARPRRAPADYPGCPVTVDIALAQGRPLIAPRWGIPDAIIPLLGFVLLSVAVALAGSFLSLPLPWLLLLGITIPWIALAGWPLVTTAFQGNGPRIDLGIRLTWSDAGWGVIGGIAALMAGGTIALVLQAIFGEFREIRGDLRFSHQAQGPPRLVLPVEDSLVGAIDLLFGLCHSQILRVACHR